MAMALLVFTAGVAASLFPWRSERVAGEAPGFAWRVGQVRAGAGAALLGPASVLAIIAGMYLFTVIGFELLQALPVAVIGGGQAH